MAREYKDSGIEWIGQIPKEWKIGKVKNYYSLQTGFTPDTKNELYYDDNGALWVNISDMGDSHYICNTKKKISDYYISKFKPTIVPKGSLLYSFKLSVGTVAIAGEEMYTNEAIATFLQKDGINLSFLYYSSQVCIIFNANENIYGAKLLNQDLINNATIIFPPLAEQQKIVDYLDKVCGEVDEMVTLQETMIEELKAYKQSVITEAVTKGLNPNVPMRNSGIDWIGEIPEGWKIVHFSKINWIRARLGWKGLKAEEYTETGYPFLSAFNIVNDKLDWSNLNFINQERYDESPEIKLSLGDLLLVKDGAGIGKCAVVEDMPYGESTVNSSIAVVTPIETNIYPKFQYYYFKSQIFQNTIWLLKIGMGVPHLTQENMKGIVLPCPSMEEQRAIVSYLDAKCSEIDSLIALKQAKIEELKEYKKSVIYEYVTGKKEVG